MAVGFGEVASLSCKSRTVPAANSVQFVAQAGQESFSSKSGRSASIQRVTASCSVMRRVSGRCSSHQLKVMSPGGQNDLRWLDRLTGRCPCRCVPSFSNREMFAQRYTRKRGRLSLDIQLIVVHIEKHHGSRRRDSGPAGKQREDRCQQCPANFAWAGPAARASNCPIGLPSMSKSNSAK